VEANVATRVDKSSPVPLYLQLKDWILATIQRGEFPGTTQIPSEADLSARFAISRGTVRQAIDELLKERRLYRVQGKGTYVAPAEAQYLLLERLIGFSDDLRRQGIPFRNTILEMAVTTPPLKAAVALSLEPTNRVYYLKRVRIVDDEPTFIADSYLPAQMCPGLLEQSLEHSSLFEILERSYNLRVVRAVRVVEPGLASEEDARHLEATTGSPVLVMENYAYLEDGRVAEYAQIRYRGDKSRFTFEVRR
jgi:GntR family transcriptional regulator